MRQQGSELRIAAWLGLYAIHTIRAQHRMHARGVSDLRALLGLKTSLQHPGDEKELLENLPTIHSKKDRTHLFTKHSGRLKILTICIPFNNGEKNQRGCMHKISLLSRGRRRHDDNRVLSSTTVLILPLFCMGMFRHHSLSLRILRRDPKWALGADTHSPWLGGKKSLGEELSKSRRRQQQPKGGPRLPSCRTRSRLWGLLFHHVLAYHVDDLWLQD